MTSRLKPTKELDAQCSSVRRYEKRTIYNTVLSWRVPDFEKLNCGVVYFQTYEKIDLKCSFRILKTKEGGLSLTVASPCIAPNTTAEFLICDELERTSIGRGAQKLRDGVYTALFQSTDFLYPESGYLRGGILTAAFKYATDVAYKFRDQEINERMTLLDQDELCCDFKRMYLDALYPDFEVHVGEYVFSTHKFLLSARSDYFRELLTEGRNLTDISLEGREFYPGIVHEVFLYMYSAELKELSEECMLRVYWTANFLGVVTLCARCLRYFGERISLENYEDICRYALEFDLTPLKNQIVRDAQSKLPGVKITDVIMKLKRQIAKEACSR